MDKDAKEWMRLVCSLYFAFRYVGPGRGMIAMSEPLPA